MFIIAQIPFVDLRILSNKTYKDCFFPNYFDRDFEKALYYRFLGQEKNRYNPNALPTSERHFFDAKKLLTLDQKGFKGRDTYSPKLLFSRFFEERQCFHFDIGIRQVDEAKVLPKDLNRFANDFLNSPIFQIDQRFENRKRAYDLVGLEKKLKEIYLYATSSKKALVRGQHSSEVVLGYPALFIMYDQEEYASSHSGREIWGNAKEVELHNGLRVHHELLSLQRAFADVWYIGKDDLPEHSQDLRNLRIYLSKLHSYKESTRLILDYLDRSGHKNVDPHKVTTFLGEVLNKIGKEQYYGYENGDFWEIAFYVDNAYNGASWRDFKDRIEAKLQDFEINSNYYLQDLEEKLNTLLNKEYDISEKDKAWIKEQMEECLNVLRDEKTDKSTALKVLQNLLDGINKVLENVAPLGAIANCIKAIMGRFI